MSEAALEQRQLKGYHFPTAIVGYDQVSIIVFKDKVDCSLNEAKELLSQAMENEAYGNLIYIDSMTQFLMKLEHDRKRGTYSSEVISAH